MVSSHVRCQKPASRESRHARFPCPSTETVEPRRSSLLRGYDYTHYYAHTSSSRIGTCTRENARFASPPRPGEDRSPSVRIERVEVGDGAKVGSRRGAFSRPGDHRHGRFRVRPLAFLSSTRGWRSASRPPPAKATRSASPNASESSPTRRAPRRTPRAAKPPSPPRLVRPRRSPTTLWARRKRRRTAFRTRCSYAPHRARLSRCPSPARVARAPSRGETRRARRRNPPPPPPTLAASAPRRRRRMRGAPSRRADPSSTRTATECVAGASTRRVWCSGTSRAPRPGACPSEARGGAPWTRSTHDGARRGSLRPGGGSRRTASRPARGRAPLPS